jgi:hypothetical protein
MLQTLQITLSKSKKQDEIELDMLIVQAKPVRDDPDILPVCYRCSSTNPLLNPFTNKFAKGDVCTNCGHPFVRSFVNFDILPLVEFVPEPRISDEEAIELIRQAGGVRMGGGKSGWKEGKEGESDMMTLDDDDDSPSRGYDEYAGSNFRGGEDQDLFTRCVNSTLENQVRLVIDDIFIKILGLVSESNFGRTNRTGQLSDCPTDSIFWVGHQPYKISLNT